jgi:hypothetical protein
LDYCHTVSKKTISTLHGVKTIVNKGYRCANPECKNASTVHRSAQAEHLSVKHITYGMDVLAFVGELRFKEHKTRKEIMDILNERGLLCRSAMSKNYTKDIRFYFVPEDHSKKILQETVETHGGIILSMDGVQPEKGNETLYVIREVLSGTILAAKNVKSSSTEELMEFIKPILEYEFPILGFVSDGQKSIRLAFERLSPGTPYQYCQFHYLKDIAKPVVDKDRKLKTNIKKKLRGIREIEKKALKEDTLESEVTLAYTTAIRSVLLEDGCPPLELPGVKVFEKTKEIQKSLKNCLDKKGPLALEKLFRIVSNVDNFTKDYHLVVRLQTRIRRIANILEPSKRKTSKSVEKRLRSYLVETEKKLTKDADAEFVDNLLRYSNGFWNGLFACYDHPILPRTNNDHELFFRKIKRRHRRITGLRSWNRYIMRHGEYIVFAEEAINDSNIVDRLTSVNYERYCDEMKSWKERTDEHVKRYQYKRNPGDYLKAIEEKWLNK